RCGVRHHADIGVGVEAVGDRVEQHVAERLDLFGAAGGGTTGDTHAAVAYRFIVEQAGIGKRLFRGLDRQPRYTAHAAQLFARPVPGHGEIVHRAGQAGVEFGEAIPLVHAADAAAVGDEIALDRCPVA